MARTKPSNLPVPHVSHVQPTPLIAVQISGLLATALACSLPLFPHLPQWLAGLCILLLLWYGLLFWRKTALSHYPGRSTLIAIALGGTLAIGAHYQSLFGRGPGVALLALLLLLKLLESRNRRDGFVTLLLACFLLMSQYFYAQDMLSGGLTLIGASLVTATLALLNHPKQTPQHSLRLASRLLLQAVPFMLLMFLLFPRIESPLWALPADAFSGVTGLNDTMSPGGISQLSQSDAIAFRARFHGALDGRAPPQQQLYWRGPVLADFDGRTWHASPTSSFVSSRVQLPKLTPAAHDQSIQKRQIVDYTVTLEPHNRAWLFALEWPISMPQPVEAGLTFDYQIWAKQPVMGRIRYDLRSTLRPLPIAPDEHRALIAAALKLPTEFNPRTRALAAQWRKEAGNNDLALVQRMLMYLHEEKFYYTLRPPLLGEDSVDDFLFNSRRGFCEHYASAFVFLMRAAGVPARVVTGYQGGELNPNDGTLIVRQSDAHAWAEVWLRDQGWRRIDPTAAVAPARTERGLIEALPAGEPLPLLSRAQLAWLHPMRLQWEAISNTWNQWVIGYNPQRQRSFLANLGMTNVDWTHLAALFSGLCAALLFAYTAWALRHRQATDPLQALWQKFSKKMAAYGLTRQPWEGPTDYVERISATLENIPGKQSLAIEAREIAARYVALRYGKTTAEQYKTILFELKQRIRQLQHPQ
ncbi:MAG: DUF3488 domain-containing transglutaminase family protein [Sterolibacterium sp.]|jgi:transglutaminase-like putative cysteine protease|nr:DUF3488 domain-containing transglutaminase family protein [Sterolibacterium sp.]